MTTTKNRRRVTKTLADAAGRKKATQKKKPQVLTNHVAVVVDRSYSMTGWENEVVRTVNEQFNNMRIASEAEGQETYVTLRTFSTHVDAPVFFAQDVSVFRDWKQHDYVTDAQTALFDAIGYTIRDFERVKGANNDSTSFLIIVVTDGRENASREFQHNIKQVITEAQATDRYSVVCLIPPWHRNGVIRNLGIPPGNVREWEQSKAGFRAIRQDVGVGLQNYYRARSTGATRTTAFFVDADHIQETDLDSLVDVSGDFFVWTVNNVAVGAKTRIDDFVQARIDSNSRVRAKVGNRFQIGRGYYELTKSELIQESKDVVIQHLDTGKMYGGRDARNLLRIPEGTRMRIRPGHLDGYRIFVKSTSVNRHLIGDTKFLYSKSSA